MRRNFCSARVESIVNTFQLRLDLGMDVRVRDRDRGLVGCCLVPT